MTPGRQGNRLLHTPRRGSSRRRQRSLLGALFATLGVLLMWSSASPAQTIDEARDQREATRAEQARRAEELDALEADAATIADVLAGLDEALTYQQAKVDAAAQGLAGAEATAAAARAEVEVSAVAIGELQLRVREAVLSSYTGGLGGDVEQFLESDSINQLSQRSELLAVVRGRYREDLEQLRALKERQRRATELAAAAVEEAANRKAELDAARVELDAQRADQARLAEALQSKIGDVQGEVDRLQAAQDELTAVINQHLAEEAAARGYSNSSAPTLSAASASGFVAPTSGSITSPFGYRVHPILGYGRLHAGTDFGASYGSPIWASKGGQVIFAGWNGGYGNCVIIAHDGGLSTLYGHQSELAVSVGEQVSQGEVIGWVGSTGASTGPHLHFEVWVGGSPTDPMNFL